jgi:L-aminopeptidase/D-esterase-like protein
MMSKKFQLQESIDFGNLQFGTELHPEGMQTGATAFYFPTGAWLSADARGGSVAASETTLLEAGSYSCQVDALVFAGGSTMGLEAADGFRASLFSERLGKNSSVSFDNIPSVPGAVVYDFTARNAGKGSTVYPDLSLGKRLHQNLSKNFISGRAGAGINTTANKMNPESTYFSGQGIAWKKYDWGSLLFAVVLNPLGDIWMDGNPFGNTFGSKMGTQPQPKTNTTLSLVLTDVPLSRAQIQRFSSMAHAALAAYIQPFHTPYDGDILFAGSLAPTGNSTGSDISMNIASVLHDLAGSAVKKAVYTAQGK